VHLEGPFLDPAHRGAHSVEALRLPSRDEAAEALAHFQGRVRLWTLAPELPGASAVVDLLCEAGVVVAAGHSGLSHEEARSWFGRGISMVTHLFNAMTGLQHRSPGLAAAALLDDRVRFSIIADGHHAHPAMLELANRLGGHRLILVTDAVAPAGAPAGAYTVAGQLVVAEKGVVRLTDGSLAGTTLGALQAVRNYSAFTGVSVAEAAVAMTSRPADLLGERDLGRLGEGALADFLILDDQGVLLETWIRGKPEYVRRPGGPRT
jgi:N-acetylglucosamine-6-phosphate deacetylase